MGLRLRSQAILRSPALWAGSFTKLVEWFIWGIGLLLFLQNVLHYNISSLLAGLGIGGLAVAFAAQDTLSNVFGAVMIFIDRPFKVGTRSA